MALLTLFLLGVAVWWGIVSSMKDAAAAREVQATAEQDAFVERLAAAFMQIMNEGLPVIDPAIRLQKGEVCHWEGPCRWLEMRSVTTRVGYRGPTISIPLMKGVRYRAGSFTPNVTRAQQLTEIDAGTLYITSKRLFFDGPGKNNSIMHAKILKVTAMLDGVSIDKATGKAPVLEIGREAAPTVAAILAKLE